MNIGFFNTEFKDLRKIICLRKIVSDFNISTGMHDESLRSMAALHAIAQME